MFYTATTKLPQYTLMEMTEWSEYLDYIMTNSGLPTVLENTEDRELYFRAVLTGNERVACRLLNKEFSSGYHSIASTIDQLSQFIAMKSLLGLKTKEIVTSGPEDYVISSDASNALYYCEIANILDGIDLLNRDDSPTLENIISARIILDFIEVFITRSYSDKEKIIRDLCNLISRAECVETNLRTKVSAVSTAAIGIILIENLLIGAATDFRLKNSDLCTSMNDVLNLKESFTNLLQQLFTLRQMIMSGTIPSLARLHPETTACRFSFLEAMRIIFPSTAIDLLELQKNSEYY